MSYAFTGVFPPTDVGFVEKEAAEYYGLELEDNTIRSPSDGGYEMSRPRYTRPPRTTFTTGFVELNENDLDIILEFWKKYQGSLSFTWTNPATLQAHTVKMVEPPAITYAGVGSLRRYNVEVRFKEV